ncbi:MAG: ExbD/TolR family protein [Myxococcales bacterium]
MKLRAHRPRRKPRIEIIPMIDIIFFLLVFYMVTSQAISEDRRQNVELPSMSEQHDEAVATEVTLGLDAEGHLSLDGQPITFAEEAQKLAEAMGQKPQAVLVVRADRRALHGEVVRAMDIARQVGVRRFAIAGQAPEADAPAAGGTSGGAP